MTEEEDIKKVTPNDNCPHRKYERRRIENLLFKLNNIGEIALGADRYLFLLCFY